MTGRGQSPPPFSPGRTPDRPSCRPAVRGGGGAKRRDAMAAAERMDKRGRGGRGWAVRATGARGGRGTVVRDGGNTRRRGGGGWGRKRHEGQKWEGGGWWKQRGGCHCSWADGGVLVGGRLWLVGETGPRVCPPLPPLAQARPPARSHPCTSLPSGSRSPGQLLGTTAAGADGVVSPLPSPPPPPPPPYPHAAARSRPRRRPPPPPPTPTTLLATTATAAPATAACPAPLFLRRPPRRRSLCLPRPRRPRV